MKTNLFKRTLSFVIVACMLIAMVAVAPMANAAVTPLTFGMDVTENADGQVVVSVYMTGYDAWDLESEGIDTLQFNVLFDTEKLTFVKSAKGSAVYAEGMDTNGCSGAKSAAAANERGYVVFLGYAGPIENDDGDLVPAYIPQQAKNYLRNYTFEVKEGATGDCTFAIDTTYVFVTDSWNHNKIVDGNLPEGWVANNGTYTIASAAPEYYIDYLAGEGFGHMDPTVGTAPVIAAPLFTKAGYTFAGWVDAEGNKYEVGAVATSNLKLIATWTANTTTAVASWYKMIGAQARTAESGKSAGMRFGVNFVGLEGVVVEEKGILMIPTDLLNGELTHDTVNVAVKQFSVAINDGRDNSEIYTAVLVNIPEGQYARPITARGYVKVNGNYYYTPAMERDYQNVLDQLSAMQ